VSFAAKVLCVASQRLFIAVSVYFVIDSVRKLLVKPSYVGYLTHTVSTSDYYTSKTDDDNDDDDDD
jgi:hypothetical protein